MRKPTVIGLLACSAVLSACGSETGGPSSDPTLQDLIGTWNYAAWQFATAAGARDAIQQNSGSGQLVIGADGTFRLEEFIGSRDLPAPGQSTRVVLIGEARVEEGRLILPGGSESRTYLISEAGDPGDIVLTRSDSIIDPDPTYSAGALKQEMITLVSAASVTGVSGRIVFTRAEGPFAARTDVYVMNADGTNLQRLTNDGWVDETPRWSPDGQRIAYASNRNGWAVFAINADGSGEVRIDPDNPGMHPTWSPDGQSIALERGGAVFIAAADGSPGSTRVGPDLTSSPPSPGWHFPDWSPAGARLVFSESSNGFVLRAAMADIDGSDVVALTDPLTARDYYPLHARWRSDGERVAFTTFGAQWQVAIATTSIADRQLDEVTEYARSAMFPAWSPDGHAIAFQSHGDIYIATLAGGMLNVTQSADFREFMPDWTE